MRILSAKHFGQLPSFLWLSARWFSSSRSSAVAGRWKNPAGWFWRSLFFCWLFSSRRLALVSLGTSSTGSCQEFWSDNLTRHSTTTRIQLRRNTRGRWCKVSWNVAASRDHRTGVQSSRTKRCPPCAATFCPRPSNTARLTTLRKPAACRSCCSSWTINHCCLAVSASESLWFSWLESFLRVAYRALSVKTTKPFKLFKSLKTWALMLTI